MKKSLPFIVIAIFFGATFFYLYQKVHVYVEAYQISENCRKYKELVDKRDYLMYNLNKEISLAKVERWAVNHDFSRIEKDRLLVLNLKNDTIVLPQKKLALSFKRSQKALGKKF